MLTFFTTAKPFQGHSGVIQRNALQSWKLLHPDVEVILFGDDEGAGQVSADLGLRHEPRVERHESGMKYLNYMFERAQRIARHDYLCYSNCDIILMNDFRKAFEKVRVWRNRFLLISQRWDTDVVQPIDFTRRDWQKALRQLARTKGLLQIRDYIDYFVFPKGLYTDVPPLIVGRSFWDWWLVWKALSEPVPVVDCSEFLMAVHQNHGYAYHPEGKQGTNEDALAKRNIALAENGKHLCSLVDATHVLKRYGKIRRVHFRRQLSTTSVLAVRQKLVELTFSLRYRLGLRRESLDKALGRRTDWLD